jgi:hypothetical protein
MQDDIQNQQASILPPKNGHQGDRQPNGSTQRIAKPFETEATIDGVITSSIKMMDQTANGELDVAQSKAALGHGTNALAGMKLKTSIFNKLDKMSPAVLGLLADVVGGHSGERFRAAIAAQHPQRQIATNDASGAQGDKPDQD